MWLLLVRSLQLRVQLKNDKELPGTGISKIPNFNMYFTGNMYSCTILLSLICFILSYVDFLPIFSRID